MKLSLVLLIIGCGKYQGNYAEPDQGSITLSLGIETWEATTVFLEAYAYDNFLWLYGSNVELHTSSSL